MLGNAAIVHIRRSPGGKDDNGDPIPSTETRTDLRDGWAWAPGASSSITELGRDGVVVDGELYGPADADVDRRTDAFEVDGDPYDIVGVPARWTSPFTGWAAGCVVALKRSEG